MTVAQHQPQLSDLASLWIRTSASPKIGFGHLRRSLALAETLRDYCSPIFILDPDDRWSAEHLINEKCRFFSGGIEQAWESMPDPAVILIDTRRTAGLDSLISAANARAIPVISIHDLGLNVLASDIIIDGSIVPTCAYASFPERKCFLGTDYMVLDPVYRILYLQNRPIREKIQSVFINMGGGDSGKYYSRVLEGLKLWAREIEVIGVPGFADWGQEALAQKDWHPLHFRWESRNIERLLFNSDLAITAGGISAYEALCAGTPLLALSYDHLQQITIQRLGSTEACIDLGPGDELAPVDLAGTLSLIETDVAKRRLLSCYGRQIVDGRGGERVAELIRQAISKSLPQVVRGCA